MTKRADLAVSFWSDRCYWVRDPDGDEVLIPMCIGSANHPSGCTCATPRSAIERAEECAEIARAEVDRLRQKLRSSTHKANDLVAENSRLRKRFREAENLPLAPAN